MFSTPGLFAAGALPGSLGCPSSHHREKSRLQHQEVPYVIRETSQFVRCACKFHFHSVAATISQEEDRIDMVPLQYTALWSRCSPKHIPEEKNKIKKESQLLSRVSSGSFGETLYCHNLHNITVIVLLGVCNTCCGLCCTLLKKSVQNNLPWYQCFFPSRFCKIRNKWWMHLHNPPKVVFSYLAGKQLVESQGALQLSIITRHLRLKQNKAHLQLQILERNFQKDLSGNINEDLGVKIHLPLGFSWELCLLK